MKLYKFLLWLILIFALTDIFMSLAYADSSITVLIDRNRYMRRSIASEVARSAVKNQPVKVSYRLRVSPCSSCYKISEWNSKQLDCFKKVRSKIKGRVLFLTEPYQENGILYTTGRANVCAAWGTGYCNITEKNNLGQSRIEAGKWACTHEMGHLLGSYHDNNFYGDCPSIMHEAPLPFVGVCPLSFSQESKNQILACVDRRSDGD